MRRSELEALGIQLPVLPTAVLGALPGPPEWAVPYYQGTLGSIANFINQPYQPYTGQRVAAAGTMNPYASNAYADQQVQ